MANKKKASKKKRKSQAIPKLYHGTLKEHIKEIEKFGGIKETQGWGGAGTFGVFLSGTYDAALLWAKIAYMVQIHNEFNPFKFDRLFPSDAAWDQIVVLEVKIPKKFESLLRVDLEQAEDVGFEGNEYDWRASLKQIGDVRFAAPVPISWLKQITP